MNKKNLILSLAVVFSVLFIFFIGTKYTGFSVSEIEVNSSPPLYKQIYLKQGMNLFSINNLGGRVPIQTALDSIKDYYDKVFVYDASDPEDPWKTYNPSLPSWVFQDAGLITDASGIIIFMEEDVLFYYVGSESRTDYIDLYRGWNLIGHPTNRTLNLTDVFGSTNYTRVSTFDSDSQIWKGYPNGTEEGFFDTLTQNSGYWIFSSNEQQVEVIQ